MAFLLSSDLVFNKTGISIVTVDYTPKMEFCQCLKVAYFSQNKTGVAYQ